MQSSLCIFFGLKYKKDVESGLFFLSAKIILRHPTDQSKVLLIKRMVNGKFSYEPAGGKVECDFKSKIAESLEECAVREAQEELGLTVKIEHYIGSYYFFWIIDSNKCSSCALFIGTITSQDEEFVANADACELPIEPEWIMIDNLINKKVPIDVCHVGLENLMINYFSK